MKSKGISNEYSIPTKEELLYKIKVTELKIKITTTILWASWGAFSTAMVVYIIKSI